MKHILTLFFVLTLGIVITSAVGADNPKKPVVHSLNSNEVPAMLVGSPNMLQEQADTIMLSTGEIIHRFDDADRQNTCYIVNSVAIHCVPANRRR